VKEASFVSEGVTNKAYRIRTPAVGTGCCTGSLF